MHECNWHDDDWECDIVSYECRVRVRFDDPEQRCRDSVVAACRGYAGTGGRYVFGFGDVNRSLMACVYNNGKHFDLI